MAKRKRLTPPVAPDKDSIPADLETKSLANAPIGTVPKTRAPITDVAESASATAALQKLAGEMDAARREGRLVIEVPIEKIDMNHLTRDRVALDAEEMEVLKTSLKSRGQQTPVELVQTGHNTRGPTYGLISGFRRLTALTALGEERVKALIRKPEDAGEAYTAMVEENEVRVGLSYFERASIVARSVEKGVFPSETQALNALFKSASRSKRSKIKSFLPVVAAFRDALQFPLALTERMGLALAAQLSKDPGFETRLCDRLRKAAPDTAEAEMALITKALGQGGDTPAAAPEAAKEPAAKPTVDHFDLPGDMRLSYKRGDLRLNGEGVNDLVLGAVLKTLRNIQK